MTLSDINDQIRAELGKSVLRWWHDGRLGVAFLDRGIADANLI